MDVVGVDACKAGWFCVHIGGSGEYETHIATDFAGILDTYKGVDLILIDIPIGLPSDESSRACDLEARRKLGLKRKSSVFPTPTRRTCEQAYGDPKDYEKAAYIQRKTSGKGLQTQAFGIAAKIGEVDAQLPRSPHIARPDLHEIHPEVLFWALNGGSAMQFSKKTSSGVKERLEVLGRFTPGPDAVRKMAKERVRARGYAADDVLDAMAAAVTGHYGFGELLTLPEEPELDAKGLPMEMVYWVPPPRW